MALNITRIPVRERRPSEIIDLRCHIARMIEEVDHDLACLVARWMNEGATAADVHCRLTQSAAAIFLSATAQHGAGKSRRQSARGRRELRRWAAGEYHRVDQ